MNSFFSFKEKCLFCKTKKWIIYGFSNSSKVQNVDNQLDIKEVLIMLNFKDSISNSIEIVYNEIVKTPFLNIGVDSLRKKVKSLVNKGILIADSTNQKINKAIYTMTEKAKKIISILSGEETTEIQVIEKPAPQKNKKEPKPKKYSDEQTRCFNELKSLYLEWFEKYQEENKLLVTGYYFEGKDGRALHQIINKFESMYKRKYPENYDLEGKCNDYESRLLSFKNVFLYILNEKLPISEWIYRNPTLGIINSQYNTIINAKRNTKQQQQYNARNLTKWYSEIDSDFNKPF